VRQFEAQIQPEEGKEEFNHVIAKVSQRPIHIFEGYSPESKNSSALFDSIEEEAKDRIVRYLEDLPAEDMNAIDESVELEYSRTENPEESRITYS